MIINDRFIWFDMLEILANKSDCIIFLCALLDYFIGSESILKIFEEIFYLRI